MLTGGNQDVLLGVYDSENDCKAAAEEQHVKAECYPLKGVLTSIRPGSRCKCRGRMQKNCGYRRKAIEGKPVVSTLLYLQGNQLARKEKEYCSERCALTTRWLTRANVNPPKRAVRPVPPTKVTPEITKTNDHPKWALPMARGFYIQK